MTERARQAGANDDLIRVADEQLRSLAARFEAMGDRVLAIAAKHAAMDTLSEIAETYFSVPVERWEAMMRTLLSLSSQQTDRCGQ